MPRPKTGRKKTETLVLTLTPAEKECLRYLSSVREVSISAIIGEYATKEAAKLEKAAKKKGGKEKPRPHREETSE